MNYTPELQEKITQLGLQKENILYLTIQNVYLHDIRRGQKNVEYRDPIDCESGAKNRHGQTQSVRSRIGGR